MSHDNRYLVHYDKNNKEIQLRAQDSVALGFCRIVETIPEEAPQSFNNGDKYITWHDSWVKYFAEKYNIPLDRIQ